MSDKSSEPLDLAIVIVNYDTSDLLRACLESVHRSTGNVRFRVCVVDNASPDDSVAMLAKRFPGTRLIANDENVGYPRANNQGLRDFGFGAPEMAASEAAGLPRFALLLNPDTVLPEEALSRMLSFMEAHPEAGAAGPKLIRLDGSLDKACRRSFPTPENSLWHMIRLDRLFPRSPRFGRYDLTYLDPDVVTPVDAVVGAFMLVRREAILQAGLLDESFFMYGEDLDWAKRITAAGWRIWYNPEVTVLHVKEAASRHSERARVEFYRAMTIFYEKHYRATTSWWLDLVIRGGIAWIGGVDLLRRRWRGLRKPAVRTQEGA